MRESGPPHVAIIGVSGYAQYHCATLLALAAAGRIKLVAATVIDAHEQRERCEELLAGGTAIYDDHHTMLGQMAGAIDLCVIPTGIPFHAPMALAALRTGCHVLLEKPAAATLSEVVAMQTVAAQRSRRVMVAFQYLYDPRIRSLQARLASGEFGAIRSIKCIALAPRGADYYQRNGWSGRLRTADGWVLDSPINNAFAHWLLSCDLPGRRHRRGKRQTRLHRGRALPRI